LVAEGNSTREREREREGSRGRGVKGGKTGKVEGARTCIHVCIFLGEPLNHRIDGLAVDTGPEIIDKPREVHVVTVCLLELGLGTVDGRSEVWECE
jgi:hypothetical protein